MGTLEKLLSTSVVAAVLALPVLASAQPAPASPPSGATAPASRTHARPAHAARHAGNGTRAAPHTGRAAHARTPRSTSGPTAAGGR